MNFFLEKGRDVLWHTPGSSTFYSDTDDVLQSLSNVFYYSFIYLWNITFIV